MTLLTKKSCMNLISSPHQIVLSLTLMLMNMLAFLPSFGQENYQPGYIVSLAGDTIYGQVDYRNWELNPDKIYFQDESDKVKRSYTPLDVRAFSVQDEFYIRAIVQAEKSPYKTNTLNDVAEVTLSIDTIFLQTLVEGLKSLYYYKQQNGKEQFYVLQPSGIALLIQKKYLKNQNGRSTVAENRRYLGQLALYLQDCSSIQSKLEDVQYTRSSLQQLFDAYYRCTNTEETFQKEVEKVTTEIGLLAGVSATTLSFGSSAFAYLAKADFSQSTDFAGGLFLDLVLPRNQRKWSVCNELMYTTYQVEGYHNNFVNENNYTVTNTEIGFSYLKLNSMIRFRYPVANVQVYLNAGMSNGLAMSETNYRRRESKLYSSVSRVEEEKALDDIRRYEQGFLLGIGAKFKKYSVETRFEKGNGVSEYTALRSSANRYYFLLSYRLK